jgi:predicted RNA-binding protein with PUA-like domain
LLVDVRYVKKLKRTVTLAEMKQEPALEGMRLLMRGNRLSIMPVESAHWDHILSMV